MSSVYKSSFVSINNIKKTIPVIDENDSRIIATYDENSDGSMPMPENISENVDVDGEKISEYQAMEFESLEGEDNYSGESMDFSNVSAPSEVLIMAKQEAELLIKEAKEMAVGIQENARELGYDEGFKKGETDYLSYLEEERQALQKKGEDLEQEYQDKIRESEYRIASIIGKLVVQLVGSRDDENIILFLVRLALAENTVKGKVVINVSDEDFPKVRNHFDENDYVDDDVQVEIKKSDRLSKNDCILETDFGVVDSSLSVRVDSFLKEINVIKESLRRTSNE